MAIKKYKRTKRLSKRLYKSKRVSKYKKHSKRNRRSRKQRGGFLNDPSCNLATVRESGFNLAGTGSIAGLSIPDTRAVIYNPNCKADTYQAMI